MIRRRRIVAASAVLTLVAGAASAWAASAPVTVSTTLGTRTLNLLDLAGNPLPNTGIALGTGKGGALLVNVADSLYSHVGYQVTAQMSDLYPYSGGHYDFTGSKIASSNVAVSYPSNLLDLSNLVNVVNPVFTLTGNLPLGLGTLAPTTVQGNAQQVATLVGHITDGTLSTLPLRVQSGTAGAFTSPAQVTDDPSAPAVSGTPTQLDVMTGTAQAGDLSGILSTLQSTISGMKLPQLISNGYLDQSAVLAAVASATGQLGLVTANASAILSSLSASLTSVGSLVGQSGSYNALPTLSVAVPTGTPTGTYRGDLVVTLMDK